MTLLEFVKHDALLVHMLWQTDREKLTAFDGFPHDDKHCMSKNFPLWRCFAKEQIIDILLHYQNKGTDFLHKGDFWQKTGLANYFKMSGKKIKNDVYAVLGKEYKTPAVLRPSGKKRLPVCEMVKVAVKTYAIKHMPCQLSDYFIEKFGEKEGGEYWDAFKRVCHGKAVAHGNLFWLRLLDALEIQDLHSCRRLVPKLATYLTETRHSGRSAKVFFPRTDKPCTAAAIEELRKKAIAERDTKKRSLLLKDWHERYLAYLEHLSVKAKYTIKWYADDVERDFLPIDSDIVEMAMKHRMPK